MTPESVSPRNVKRALAWLSARRPLVGALLVVAMVVAAAPLLRASKYPPVTQPIAFNHRLHTKDLELDCEFCHKYVRTSAHSGLPGAETCSICHRVQLGKSEEAARLTQLLNDGQPLRFNKLFRLKDYVFYTHRRHVGIAQLDCSNCHGAIADTERPPKRPLVRIKMKFCLGCHEETGQTLDCNGCHR